MKMSVLMKSNKGPSVPENLKLLPFVRLHLSLAEDSNGFLSIHEFKLKTAVKLNAVKSMSFLKAYPAALSRSDLHPGLCMYSL